jgi:hypothetical protein
VCQFTKLVCNVTGLFFLILRHVYWGEAGKKLVKKKYNIDYFGYAVNLEFKLKLNFDQERGSGEGVK